VQKYPLFILSVLIQKGGYTVAGAANGRDPEKTKKKKLISMSRQKGESNFLALKVPSDEN
jgi:hypothetical protein